VQDQRETLPCDSVQDLALNGYDNVLQDLSARSRAEWLRQCLGFYFKTCWSIVTIEKHLRNERILGFVEHFHAGPGWIGSISREVIASML
jgi:hypothetical protein